MARNGLRLEFDQRAHSDKPACVFRQGSEALPGTRSGLYGSSVADFWRGKDGDVWLRVTWMGQVWSFHARGPAGESIPDDQDSMAVFADFVSRELCRWMTEDAPDTPPFDACTAAEQENFSSGRKA